MVIKRSPGGQACRWRAVNFEIHLWSSGKNADCIFGDRSASSMCKWRPAWTLTPEMIPFGTMGAIHKMAHVGVCGALLRRGPCWMYGWLPVTGETHLPRTTFCSFCLNTLRVILTDDLPVRRTWKIKPEKELEQDFSIFSDRWQWDSEQRTTLQTGLYGDPDCGCRWQATPSLGFCFPHRKGFHT